MLEEMGILKIASVGDSGLKVIREGRTIFSSTPQEHYFDCPYQLSSEESGQTYVDASFNAVEVTKGNNIVMGSDGLFDNLFDYEIIKHHNVAKSAKLFAELASKHRSDPNFESPYSLEARSKVVVTNLHTEMSSLQLSNQASNSDSKRFVSVLAGI